MLLLAGFILALFAAWLVAAKLPEALHIDRGVGLVGIADGFWGSQTETASGAT